MHAILVFIAEVIYSMDAQHQIPQNVQDKIFHYIDKGFEITYRNIERQEN